MSRRAIRQPPGALSMFDSAPPATADRATLNERSAADVETVRAFRAFAQACEGISVYDAETARAAAVETAHDDDPPAEPERPRDDPPRPGDTVRFWRSISGGWRYGRLVETRRTLSTVEYLTINAEGRTVTRRRDVPTTSVRRVTHQTAPPERTTR